MYGTDPFAHGGLRHGGGRRGGPCGAATQQEEKQEGQQEQPEETEQAIRFVEGLDIRTISEQVMQALFRALAMRFEFSLAGITLPAQK